MTPSPSTPAVRFAVGPTVPLLAAVTLLAAYGAALPALPALVLAALGVGLGVVLRGVRSEPVRATFPVPVLLVLGFLALSAGVGALELLIVGLAGATFVAWLTDDPYRPPSGAGRGALLWLLPTLGVTTAWASLFLLPRSSSSVGIAGGLVAGALAVLAYLLSRPDLFDRETTATI